MVKVGDRLISPKDGWRRYEENALTYSGLSIVNYGSSYQVSGGRRLEGGGKGSFFAFGLKGNKFALIDYIAINRCDFDVYVNGELFDTYINPRNINSSSQTVYYIGEVTGKENHIKVVDKGNGSLVIDCIDVPQDSEIIPYDENYKGYLTFIKDNNTLHTKEGEKPFTKENLTEENGYELSELDRKLTTFDQRLASESFYKKSTINLKKYFDIHSIGVGGRLVEKKIDFNMTSNTTPAPYVASSGSVWENHIVYQPWKAFNGKYTDNYDVWIAGVGIKKEWLQIFFGKERTVSKIVLKPFYPFINQYGQDSGFPKKVKISFIKNGKDMLIVDKDVSNNTNINGELIYEGAVMCDKILFNFDENFGYTQIQVAGIEIYELVKV